MIIRDDSNKKAGISNENMELVIGYDGGIFIEKWMNKYSDPSYLPGSNRKELFHLDIEGSILSSMDFKICEINAGQDKTQELVGLTSTVVFDRKSTITCRFSIMNNSDNTMDIIFQMKAEWENGIPKAVRIQFPFLSDFPSINGADNTQFFPANPKQQKDGASLMRMHSEFVMPLGIFDEKEETGFSLTFPTEFPGVMNYNWVVNRISSRAGLKDLNIPVLIHSEFKDILVFKVRAVKNGWTEFFDTWRSEVRKKFRFNEYFKPENQWYKSTYMHHFTYIFGKEAYNYEAGRVDTEQLANQGEEFGGYDAVLIWHQYPRLGADERTQWDFFDDFPGGRKALKDITCEFHTKGIRVFLPFKPWDVRSSKSLDSEGEELAKLVADTDIDGFFLDTMDSVPVAFRHAVDRVKKGVVFCSEGQPSEQQNIEILTGSWDQTSITGSGISANLLRFVMPEHYEPMISRCEVGSGKDMLIRSAIFNGTGLVIWQDVFGAWLPYSNEQKGMVKRWKKLLKSNNGIFFCSHPIPLIPTLKEGLYCNYFPSDDGNSAIYVFYNSTDENINGELAIHLLVQLKNAEECWYGTEAVLASCNGKIAVCGTVNSRDIAIIKVY